MILTREPETGIRTGTRAGQPCNRPVPVYRTHLLRGWDYCRGRMVRRNGYQHCPKCEAVAA